MVGPSFSSNGRFEVARVLLRYGLVVVVMGLHVFQVATGYTVSFEGFFRRFRWLIDAFLVVYRCRRRIRIGHSYAPGSVQRVVYGFF